MSEADIKPQELIRGSVEVEVKKKDDDAEDDKMKKRSDNKETHPEVCKLCSCWHVGGGEATVLSLAIEERGVP